MDSDNDDFFYPDYESDAITGYETVDGIRIFRFATESQAYNATQVEDTIRDGDIVIANDTGRIAILIKAWPTAIHYAPEGMKKAPPEWQFHTFSQKPHSVEEHWRQLDGGKYAHSAEVALSLPSSPSASQPKTEHPTIGTKFMRLYDADLTIYGEVIGSPYEEDQETIERLKQRGVMFTRCYSKVVPEGEIGNTREKDVVFIPEEAFQVAKSAGWPTAVILLPPGSPLNGEYWN